MFLLFLKQRTEIFMLTNLSFAGSNTAFMFANVLSHKVFVHSLLAAEVVFKFGQWTVMLKSVDFLPIFILQIPSMELQTLSSLPTDSSSIL